MSKGGEIGGNGSESETQWVAPIYLSGAASPEGISDVATPPSHSAGRTEDPLGGGGGGGRGGGSLRPPQGQAAFQRLIALLVQASTPQPICPSL